MSACVLYKAQCLQHTAFSREKRCPSLPNNASHAFMWPPLNETYFQPIKGHISHQILFKLAISALKITTSSDYYGSCSYYQWPEHRITISVIFPWNFSMPLQLCLSEFTCINISFSNLTIFKYHMLLLYAPFSTKKMAWVHHNNTMIENLPLPIGPLLKFWNKKKN